MHRPSATAAVVRELGEEALFDPDRDGMGAADFAEFVRVKHAVPGAFFSVGGASRAATRAAEADGPPLPLHHSAHFQIDARDSITDGIEGLKIAVRELLFRRPVAGGGEAMMRDDERARTRPGTTRMP